MGSNDDSNPEKNENKNTSTPKAIGSTMPRAQSNLDILSQTAAVVEEVTLCGSSSDSSSTTSDPSTAQAARVTPAEHHHTYYQIKKSNAYYPVDDQCQSSFLALPEISSSSRNRKAVEYHHQPQPSIFLEKKRGFLPPALSFETCGGMLVGGQPFSNEASSNYYSPGLFLSYSNGSGVTATVGTGCSNLVGLQRVMSPPQDQVMSQQYLYTTAATVSTGSNNSNSGGGSSPPSGADGDTAVNSFLANPSNSFSSAGGASLSSSANIAAVPTSSQYQFSSVHATQPPFPIHNAVFVPPPPPQRADNTGPKGGIEFSDEMLRENFVLRQQLASSNATISNLQNQVELLQNEIRQLRQVPSGKISQIPLEEMLTIMREYGSEVSDTAMPPRKSYVQKASVVRQFRRWNPNFTEWFDHINGKWIPKLGTEGEKKRRQDARLVYSEQRSKKPKTGSKNDDDATNDVMVVAAVNTEPLPQEVSVLKQDPQVSTDGSNVKNASTGIKKVKNLTEI